MTNLQDVKKGLFECYVCRDGQLNIDCECGRKKKEGNGVVKTAMATHDYEVLLIPEFYRGKEFNMNTLIETHPNIKNNGEFQNYAQQLKRIHDSIKAGKVPNKSGVIIAPRTFAKVTFAYSCLQHAELNGLSTFPVMDTQEIARFLVHQEERPFQPVKGFGENFNWTYEDFLTADVLFITVTKGFYRQKSYAIIEQVLDMRSRYGKSTFIISAFSLAEMTGFDRTDKSARMIDRTQKDNPQRYPVFVQYLDDTNLPKKV